MITRRVLPPEEWDKVAHLEPFASGGLPGPDHWRIVVVERDGQIVGFSNLFDAVHWDAFWIADAERGNPVVVKDLVEAGVEVMDAAGIDLVHTTIPLGRPDLARQLTRLGFVPTTSELYIFKRERG